MSDRTAEPEQVNERVSLSADRIAKAFGVPVEILGDVTPSPHAQRVAAWHREQAWARLGLDAHSRGEPLSACPFSASDPQGRGWRAGWLDAEADAHRAAGTYGATADEIARARSTLGPARRDPVSILTDPDPEWDPPDVVHVTTNGGSGWYVADLEHGAYDVSVVRNGAGEITAVIIDPVLS